LAGAFLYRKARRILVTDGIRQERDPERIDPAKIKRGSKRQRISRCQSQLSRADLAGWQGRPMLFT